MNTHALRYLHRRLISNRSQYILSCEQSWASAPQPKTGILNRDPGTPSSVNRHRLRHLHRRLISNRRILVYWLFLIYPNKVRRIIHALFCIFQQQLRYSSVIIWFVYPRGLISSGMTPSIFTGRPFTGKIYYGLLFYSLKKLEINPNIHVSNPGMWTVC